MSVSTNNLFHFTNKESLLSILTNNFIPYYSLETLLSGELELAIPMVSFCDIPLTQTSEHIKEYGNYAIGLTKEWGIRNKLNPVIYLGKDSMLNVSMNLLIKEVFAQAAHKGGFSPEAVPLIKSLLFYIYYSKPYEGSNWNKISKSFKKNAKCLYNEREWRYVPQESIDKSVNFLFKKTFLDGEKMKTHKENLKNKKLFFSPEDISYIILQDDSEIMDMVENLYSINERYSNDQKKIIITRIITTKQIMNDF